MEGEAHQGTDGLLSVGATGAGVEQEGAKLVVVHSTTDMAVAADHEVDGVGEELLTDGTRPMAWVATDVGHPDAEAFEFETLVFRVAEAQIGTVGIAIDNAAGLAGGFEAIADGRVDNVTGQPDFVARLCVVEVAGRPVGVGIGEEEYCGAPTPRPLPRAVEGGFHRLEVASEEVDDLGIDVVAGVAARDAVVAVGVGHHVKVEVMLHELLSELVGILWMDVVVGGAGDDEEAALELVGTGED